MSAHANAASAVDADFFRAIVKTRRVRDEIFGPGLFADPAWDMMLDLMIARLSRQRVAVSSLCIAAAVPPSTAIRWVKALTERGIFIRADDPDDARRVFIELSDDTAAAMMRWAEKFGGTGAGA